MNKICKNCKDWNKVKGHELTSICEKGLGRCFSDKWNINPNYYSESEEPTAIDGVNVTYKPKTGPEFGCVHFN